MSSVDGVVTCDMNSQHSTRGGLGPAPSLQEKAQQGSFGLKAAPNRFLCRSEVRIWSFPVILVLEKSWCGHPPHAAKAEVMMWWALCRVVPLDC